MEKKKRNIRFKFLRRSGPLEEHDFIKPLIVYRVDIL